jgi:signal transduction histidine kinase
VSENVFRPRARLLLQLGDQLIKNESIALLELVKNAYDAGATIAEIKLTKLNDAQHGTISIQDDGCGMDMDVIKNVWLEPGSDYKSQLLEELTKHDTKLQRRPLGEKGIGRFSVHKLGRTVELTTRMKGQKEIFVKIDWLRFEKAKYIDQVPVEIAEREPTLFKGRETGTRIVIRNLRTSRWSDKDLQDVVRSVHAMSSPFETPDAFRVFIAIDDPTALKEVPTLEDIKDAALYRFRCKIEGSEITEFRYEFTPYDSMKELKGHTITEKSDRFETLRTMVGKAIRNPDRAVKEAPVIDLNANQMKIGPVIFEGLIFDRQSKVLRLAHIDGKTVRKYLDENGGVRVYRDGIRVYDYGEPENDWLALEKSRLYDPGVKINAGLILAAVHLNREASTDLVEKTNREGFVDNVAYRTFRAAVLYAIGIVETFRNPDKERVRNFYGLSAKSEPVLASVAELRDLVETGIKDERLQNQCLKYLQKIEKDYQQINEVLLTSAEAGLNMSVAIHEIEKLTSELKKVVREEKSSERIVKLIQHLSELIETYGSLLRKSKRKREDLKELIDEALFNVQFRLRHHKVTIVNRYSTFRGNSEITCSPRLVIGSLLNLIDNAIYWFHRADIKDKKICITLSATSSKSLRILVADNGPGFSMPPEQMLKPFVSLKPGGMGLGLHIASEVLSAQGGSLEFPKFNETDLDKEFKNGAIVALNFKREGQ